MSVEIKSYRDLIVWKSGLSLVKRIYAVTRQFPKDEIYILTSQIKRCAISVPSNIAEGHSRKSTADFITYVSTSIGSLAELDTQLAIALDQHYITDEIYGSLVKDIEVLQRQLHTLRTNLKKRKIESLIPNP